MEAEKHVRPSATARKKAARLMAVQAVYQNHVNHKEPTFVVDEYLYLRKNMEIDGEILVEPDGALFKSIVMGVAEKESDLNDLIAANRTVREGQKPADEPLLMAVFLCGAYELLAHPEFDAPLIIGSYLEVARAFFTGQEPALINGVLDSIAKVTRT